MRPLSAVVIGGDKETGLEVRLETGLVATIPYDKKYHTGQELLVVYNFTNNRAKVFIPREEADDNQEEEEELDTMDDL